MHIYVYMYTCIYMKMYIHINIIARLRSDMSKCIQM